MKNHSGVLQTRVHESSGAAYHSDSNAFSELEGLLKQKTFTRYALTLPDAIVDMDFCVCVFLMWVKNHAGFKHVYDH